MRLLSDPIGWWCALGRPLRHLSRGGAIAVLLVLAATLAWAAITVPRTADAYDVKAEADKEENFTDLQLYAHIHERFRQGESYYAAALDEQRRHNYPTKPFVTVRLPTMAWIDTHLAGRVRQLASFALMLGIVLAWIGALSPFTNKAERLAASFLFLAAGGVIFADRALLFHEVSAGMLVSLGMGLYRKHRWWPALIAIAGALAIRELALPFLLLWGAIAVLERRWKEVAAIGALLAIYAVALGLHANAVAEYRLPGDASSPGWSGLIGPQMALFSLTHLTVLLFLPVALAAPIAVLPLIGWIGLGGRLGLVATGWFTGFALAIALFARIENFYWIMLVLPAYAAGLAFVPRALADLVQTALGRQVAENKS
ncbi:hypothetical protein [Alteraurantiacibacter aquimixticola]|uniref:DUF2029 domain-containing protein n=1 Tax=Alteraurantiacibacter aquimixticola TaxID=2489173 RepID=A0A4T3F1I5_9SPHN|nr:hypothetical protein [Alteraurantiacibacter aquimixticola]TIX51053.1 hypothetical protein E5222_00775 [Alteraurantiacibacter aquimixticola]